MGWEPIHRHRSLDTGPGHRLVMTVAGPRPRERVRRPHRPPHTPVARAGLRFGVLVTNREGVYVRVFLAAQPYESFSRDHPREGLSPTASHG